MPCPICGQTVPPDSTFCPNCGNPMPSADLAATRPFQPSLDLDLPAGTDTERVPSLDMEIQDSDDALGQTTADPSRDFGVTVIDAPPSPVDESLIQTLVDPPDQDLAPIPFSEIHDEYSASGVTGERPLDFSDFASTRHGIEAGPSAVALGPERDPARKTTRGRPSPWVSAPEAAVASERQSPVAPPVSPGIGGVRALAIVTAITWVLLASLMVTAFLNIPPVPTLLARVPLPMEVWIGLPGGLLLLLLLFAAGARHRLAGVGRVGSWLRYLLWVLLAALPGIGLLLGMIGVILFIARNRPLAGVHPDPGAVDRVMGWLLLFFTLAWQDIAAVIVLTHLRAHLPF